MPAYRADKLEECFTAMASLAPRGQIVRSLATKWNVRARTAARYVAEAERILAARARDPQALEEKREEFTNAAMLLYRKQLAAAHYAAAARTLDMIGRWHGLGTPQLSAAIHLHAPNGVMTSQAAIAEQMTLLEAEQEARAHALAKQIAGQLTSGDSDGENNIDDESNSEDGGGDDGGNVH
jgi:hypothetical protein